MSRHCTLAVTVVLLATPSLGRAQPLQSFQDLALRVNLHDELRIEAPSGATTSGRLTSLGPEELVVATSDGERRLSGATVGKVSIRRRALRTGVLVGAGIGAIAGALAGCTGEDREECADAPLLLGGLGAAAGAAVGALMPRTTVVYVAPSASTAPGAAPRRPGPLDAIGLHANLGDRIRVTDRSGARHAGRLTGLTGDTLTLEGEAGERRFTHEQVQQVALRGPAMGLGALVGAGTFAAAALASSSCRDNPDCQPLAVAAVGAGVGVAVGALVPRMRPVYRAEEPPHASIRPAFSRGAVGVRAIVRW